MGLIMKRVFFILTVSVLLLACASLSFGCSKGIQEDKIYHCYTYDAVTNRFVDLGAAISFGDGFESFRYDFSGGDLSITGSAVHTNAPDSYMISCDEEMITVVVERYREKLKTEEGSEDTLALFDAISAFETPSAQFFSYNGYLFLGESLELYHAADKDSDEVEGYYHMEGSTDLVYLHGGDMYVKDEKGNYEDKRGYYTMNSDILTLTSVDEKGQDAYKDGVLLRKKYLMAKVTIPTEGELLGTSLEERMETSDFSNVINSEFSDYSGKTITVFAEAFFARSFK